jgi:hypothetical protein
MSSEGLRRALAYAGEERMDSRCATIHRNGQGEQRWDAQGARLNPLGLFLRTSIRLYGVF